ncbi:MAG TPA: hypothetical protein VML96_04940 [Egibacteraceae bacterium]|nr:hypothetical protein [Egibacteraceae bacterium]
MRRFYLMLGIAIGYVLGSRAGRERYEQIRSAWLSITKSEPAQQIGAEVRGVASRAGHALEDRASQGVHRVTAMVRGNEVNGAGS